MTIDIIDYTETQLAELTSVQLQEVREAQLKKNALRKKYDELCKKARQKLVDRGIFPSNILARKLEALEGAFEAEVAVLREGLLFFLRYGGGAKEDIPTDDVPYEVDYSTTVEERARVLKAYYESAYTDPTERFNAFDADSFARNYLGEMYAPMWHYLQDLANA